MSTNDTAATITSAVQALIAAGVPQEACEPALTALLDLGWTAPGQQSQGEPAAPPAVAASRLKSTAASDAAVARATGLSIAQVKGSR